MTRAGLRSVVFGIALAAWLPAQSQVGFRVLDPEDLATSARGRVLVTRMGDDGPQFVGALPIEAGVTKNALTLAPGSYDFELALHGRSGDMGSFDVAKDGPAQMTRDLIEPGPGVLVTATLEIAPGKPVAAGSRWVLDLERQGASFARARWSATQVEVMCDAEGQFTYGLPAPSDNLDGLREFQTFCSARVLPLDGTEPAEGSALRGFRSLQSGTTWDLGIVRTSQLLGPGGLSVRLRDAVGRAILGLSFEVEATVVGKPQTTWTWSTDQLDDPTVELERFPVASEVRIKATWGERAWTAVIDSTTRRGEWSPPPLVRLTGRVLVPNPKMRRSRLRAILSTGDGNFVRRYSAPIERETGSFSIPEVLPGTYDLVIDNPWAEASEAGEVIVEGGRGVQDIGPVSFLKWRTLLVHEPKMTGAGSKARGAQYVSVSWTKDGKRAPTRRAVDQLVEELLPGHFRISVPPSLDLDRWGIELRSGGKTFKHPRLADLIGASPDVVVSLAAFKDHLTHRWLKTVLVLRREGMPWTDGIRVDLDRADLAAGTDAKMISFPGEWKIGLELSHAGHGGMAVVELGAFDVSPNGADRFVPGPRKLGAVIEAVTRLKE